MATCNTAAIALPLPPPTHTHTHTYSHACAGTNLIAVVVHEVDGARELASWCRKRHDLKICSCPGNAGQQTKQQQGQCQHRHTQAHTQRERHTHTHTGTHTHTRARAQKGRLARTILQAEADGDFASLLLAHNNVRSAFRRTTNTHTHTHTYVHTRACTKTHA